jgi:hypothetical protein
VFKREDWIFGLISTALGIAVLIYSKTFDVITSMDPAGPAAMPRIVAWMMILIGIVHIAASLRIIKRESPKEKRGEGGYRSVALICAACAVYYLALEYVGYLVMTPLLIIAIMTSVGERDVKKMLGTSIATTAILFGIFYYALLVNMPLGILSSFFN